MLREGPTVSNWVTLSTSSSSRRAALCLGTLGTLCGVTQREDAAQAEDYVQGEAVPDGYSLDMWSERENKYGNFGKAKNCIGIDECVEVGRNSERQQTGLQRGERDFKVTQSQVRYKDYVEGDAKQGVAKAGKTISVKYRILRQGKRSNNGLDGNAATIFSVGFGEDDGPKDALLTAPLGEGKWVKALEDAIVGMAVGGVRRIQVRADDKYAKGFGWTKNDGTCAQDAVGGSRGGSGLLGNNREACMSDTLLPQPGDWAGKRRFARRFDETVIAEIELVTVA